MQLQNYYSSRLAVAALCLMLGACIGSPLPNGTVGALYQWDDQETPFTTREGILSEYNDGFFDGDFDFSNLLLQHPELIQGSDLPFLLEACDETQCFSIVLFTDGFMVNDQGTLTGNAFMNSVTTLMANEVRGLPAAEVKGALDLLASQLMADSNADYSSFIQLDLSRAPGTHDRLLYPELYDEAVALHFASPLATVQTLLGNEVESTSDLVAPQDFAFDSSWQLTVDVSLTSYQDRGAYLLLCRRFERDGTAWVVDYASCPLQAPLDGGNWQGELKLTGITRRLLAVVMPLDDPNQSEHQLWRRQFDGDVLQLR